MPVSLALCVLPFNRVSEKQNQDGTTSGKFPADRSLFDLGNKVVNWREKQFFDRLPIYLYKKKHPCLQMQVIAVLIDKPGQENMSD